MEKREQKTGPLHQVPNDLRSVLDADPEVRAAWERLTPLARNEWICWVTIVKKQETRAAHLMRLSTELREGKRRPCCFPGCPHRRPSAQKWFSRSKRA